MDPATVIVILFVSITIVITLASIRAAFGPGSEDLHDPLMDHSHGPGGHSHGPSGHGHYHYAPAHSHSHDHHHDSHPE